MNNPANTFWSYSDLLSIAIGSSVLCFLFILLFSPLARTTKLLDKPNERKHHVGSIPLVGGIAIALAVMVITGIFGAFTHPGTLTLIVIGTILVLLGVLDDYKDISPSYRLLVQAAIGIALCFVAELKVVNVGNLVGNGHLVLGYVFSIVFTVMCSIGVFNSINMIDGSDGLAGTIVMISAGSLAWLAVLGQDTHSAGMLVAIVAAVGSFMFFNLSAFGVKYKIFLGDSGSLFLGFVLLWFFIALSQGTNAVMSPVVAGWVFGVPLADTVSVMVSRILRGEHPLRAGRDHIHHRLLARGFEAKAVLLIILAYHLTFNIIGILFNGVDSAEPILFWGFVGITVCHFYILNVILPRRGQIHQAINTE